MSSIGYSYDAEGTLVYIANTKTFVIPVDMANGLKDGTYVLHVAATPTEDVIMGTDGLPVVEEDGISEIHTQSAQPTTTYDLSGRRIEGRQMGHGLYIRSGRVVLR